MTLIEVRDLKIGYREGICENINFVLDEGDFLVITGENGAGKSTLIKTILGIIPKISGFMEVNVREIGYLSQKAEIPENFPAKSGEIVLSGNLYKMGLRPFYNRAERTLAEKNMERMGILGIKDKLFRNLSGGQKQRVLLARALTASSKLIVLDEPLNSLDKKTKEDFYNVIGEINREGTAVIMITHEMTGVAKYATKVLNLGDNIFCTDLRGNE